MHNAQGWQWDYALLNGKSYYFWLALMTFACFNQLLPMGKCKNLLSTFLQYSDTLYKPFYHTYVACTITIFAYFIEHLSTALLLRCILGTGYMTPAPASVVNDLRRMQLKSAHNKSRLYHHYNECLKMAVGMIRCYTLLSHIVTHVTYCCNA